MRSSTPLLLKHENIKMAMCTERPRKYLKAPPTRTLAVPTPPQQLITLRAACTPTHHIIYTPAHHSTATPSRVAALTRAPLCAPSLALAPPWRVRRPLSGVRCASNHDTGERRRRAPASVSSLASVAGAGRCLTRWSGCVVCHAHARVYRRVLCSCK